MADATYNNMRHKRGETNPVSLPCSGEVKAGDLMVQLGTVGVPLQNHPWPANSGIAVPQETAHDNFLGVALDAKPATPAVSNLLIGTEGVYAYPCAALGADKLPGTLFGPASGSLTDALAPQKVAEVNQARLAVGRLAEKADSGATQVYLNIAGSLTTPYGGVSSVETD